MCYPGVYHMNLFVILMKYEHFQMQALPKVLPFGETYAEQMKSERFPFRLFCFNVWITRPPTLEFKSGTVPEHVCKKQMSVVIAPFTVKARGAQNVTNTMVSSPCLGFRNDPCSISSASHCPRRRLPDCQTLRVCGELASSSSEHPSCTSCRLIKRYVGAASALPAVGSSDGSSLRTRCKPRDVTHVMVSALPLRFPEML